MQYIGNCPHCGGGLKSVSIGWKCDKCGGFVDIQGNFHEPVKEPFIPDDVLKEQDEITGGKYRRAIDRMGRFGLLFLEEAEAQKEEDTAIMPMVKDLAGNEWMPVRRGVIALNIETCKGLQERAEKAERNFAKAVTKLRQINWCSGCRNFKGINGCELGSVMESARSTENDFYEFGESED